MKQCSKCGETKPLSEFYLKNGKPRDSRCKECKRAEQREYYQEHPEEGKENSRRWRKENPERAAELHREWMKEHKEEYAGKHREYSRQWRLRNPQSVLKRWVVRILRLIQSEEHFTDEEWQELFRESGSRCAICGSTKNLTVDHIIPLSKGGSDTIDNIQILCRKHNSQKKDKS